VTMDALKTVTATFTINSYLVIPFAGSNGTISPSTNVSVNHGATTVFTVTPSVGYTASVSGSCGGTLVGTTYTTNPITASCSVFANFTLNAYLLTVTPAGTGTGSVTSAPAGISCPADCTETYNHGTVVTLTAAANTGSTFTGWSGGGCSGTGTCVVTLTGATTVTPTFTQSTFTITPSAGANGTISPNTPQSISQGSTAMFTVTANSGYTASVGGTCGGSLVANNFTTSPITANCTVVASFSQNLSVLAVHSRKVHGSAGTFNLPIDDSQPISGAVTVEPRAIGSGHTIVFTFSGAVGTTGTATSTIGTAVASAGATNEVIVTLTGVPNRQRATVTLNGVNGTTSATASLGFLVGDINNSRTVTAGDLSSLKARSGQVANLANFMMDLNASGAIGAADIATTKARIGNDLLP
ncbi:MAG: hypothetical protein ABI790_00480, partial [Betaproteobacteria bacterium]